MFQVKHWLSPEGEALVDESEAARALATVLSIPVCTTVRAAAAIAVARNVALKAEGERDGDTEPDRWRWCVTVDANLPVSTRVAATQAPSDALGADSPIVRVGVACTWDPKRVRWEGIATPGRSLEVVRQDDGFWQVAWCSGTGKPSRLLSVALAAVAERMAGEVAA